MYGMFGQSCPGRTSREGTMQLRPQDDGVSRSYLGQWLSRQAGRRPRIFQAKMITGAASYSTFRVEFGVEERAMGQVGMWDVLPTDFTLGSGRILL